MAGTNQEDESQHAPLTYEYAADRARDHLDHAFDEPFGSGEERYNLDVAQVWATLAQAAATAGHTETVKPGRDVAVPPAGPGPLAGMANAVRYEWGYEVVFEPGLPIAKAADIVTRLARRYGCRAEGLFNDTVLRADKGDTILAVLGAWDHRRSAEARDR